MILAVSPDARTKVAADPSAPRIVGLPSGIVTQSERLDSHVKVDAPSRLHLLCRASVAVPPQLSF
jgi:hypothetical protein